MKNIMRQRKMSGEFTYSPHKRVLWLIITVKFLIVFSFMLYVISGPTNARFHFF